MKKKNGISLVLYLKDVNGLAQVGRDFISKISLTNFDFDVFDISLTNIIKDNYERITSNYSRFKKCLIFDTQQRKLVGNFYTIKILFWEFESGMLEFRPKSFEDADEVIAYTDFIYDYLVKAKTTNVKITKMKYPFIKNWEVIPMEIIREKYNIPKDNFVCFFNFDYRSCYERKNPEAVLKSFKEALGTYENTNIIIKTTGFDNLQLLDHVKKLGDYIKKLGIEDKVILINEYLSRNESISLINASNCYISLHRGEGLGLGMLEAMSLSKPVIATNYSGNTEFTKEDNSLLVDYKIVDVKKEQVEIGPYFGVKQWAEPNVETAKKHLKYLYNNPEFAKQLGERAKKFVDEYYNLEDFKLEVEKVFGIKERDKKADCLYQKKKKKYFLTSVKNTITAKILKKPVSRHVV